MKALSLIQPWGTLIAFKEKKIETRSWATKYRGPLLIHAGKKIEKKLCDEEPFYSTLHSLGIDTLKKIPTGVIIAKGEIMGCLKIIKDNGDSAILEDGTLVWGDEYYFGDYTPGRYAWFLENIEVLKDPIPAKGQLSLWNFDYEE